MKSFSTNSILIYIVSVLILIALCNNPLLQVLIYSAILIVLLVIDKKTVKGSVILSLLIGLPILILNPLLNGMGATILYKVRDLPLIGNITITLESLFFALSLALKLISTVLAFSLFNQLVHPDKLLNLISFAAKKSVLVITLTARMIPLLTEQMKELSEIQRTRGVNLDSGNLIQRVKNWYPFAKILLFSSLEKTYLLAEAIESKAYGTGKRTIYYNEKVRRRDWILFVDSILILLLTIISVQAGWLDYTFFPRLGSLLSLVDMTILTLGIPILVLFPSLIAWGYSQWQFSKPKI